ncbi:DNA polymerase III subunit delta' [Amaricoccus solimangrovi]|uniref:DNA polymerase III subunit delta n=1 Tax=Amaricoccus solimangrovi TaxID=2589815 RepID=A0A501WT82_9RHOB|nr:DNA polymerase III subunit delta' [Amaricoccus solimangrovi]TPE52923.1 DNA polymerase III subunit delta' [Amaricoccus solimangrovi]
MSEAESDRLEGAPHPRMTARLHGQTEAEARFVEALRSGRPPHGWMITGPRGIGKATLAWRIARTLIAGGAVPEDGTLDMDPAHPVFRQVAALAAPRLFLCRRPWDEKAKRLRAQITVDEVRALKAFFQMSAAEGGWRVAIVDAADEMNTGAANALLKVLEEPPERSALLLVCHQPGLLPPTIRSRCRVLRCAPLGAEDLSRALAEAGLAPPPGEAAALGALAGGSVGAAAGLIAGDGLAVYAELLALLARAPGMDRRRLGALAESCAARDAGERYRMVLDLIGLALSRLALAGAGGAVAPVSETEAAVWERLAPGPGPARLWAATAAELLARAAHARAVHLDPAQVILDTCLRIDTAATEARVPAH